MGVSSSLRSCACIRGYRDVVVGQAAVPAPGERGQFRLHFVEQASNVVFIGAVGLGKSHLAIALGRRACEERYSVLFRSAVDVINTLTAAQAIARLKQGLNRYIKPLALLRNCRTRPNP